jgi:hypothetical protein
VDITLETESGSEVFSASKAALVKHSSLFEELLIRNPKINDTHTQCEIVCFPAVFGQFIQWIKYPRAPIKYKPGAYSEDFWMEYAVSAWFLAQDLGALEFEKYALSQFIQNCSLALFGPWEIIQRKATSDAALQKFSNHWVAWNHHLLGGRDSEYSGLDATKLVVLLTVETKDPRIYSVGHWYAQCGTSFGSCYVHDHELREQNLIFGTRQKQQVVDEWGAEFEKRI